MTDGTSNTLAVSEKRLKLARMYPAGGANLTYDDNESFYSPGWDSELLRAAVTNDPGQPAGSYGPTRDLADALPTEADPNSGLSAFGSSHPAGVNAAMGDGSVRVFRYDPAAAVGGQNVFRRVCVRNDGVPYNLKDLN